MSGWLYFVLALVSGAMFFGTYSEMRASTAHKRRFSGRKLNARAVVGGVAILVISIYATASFFLGAVSAT